MDKPIQVTVLSQVWPFTQKIQYNKQVFSQVHRETRKTNKISIWARSAVTASKFVKLIAILVRPKICDQREMGKRNGKDFDLAEREAKEDHRQAGRNLQLESPEGTYDIKCNSDFA